jgi:hypothetical protein
VSWVVVVEGISKSEVVSIVKEGAIVAVISCVSR